MRVLILSDDPAGAKRLVPALELLGHHVSTGALSTDAVHSDAIAKGADIVAVDASSDPAAASLTCRTLAASEFSPPVLVIADHGALPILKASWGFEDWVLPSVQPAELETRMRLLVERSHDSRPSRPASIGDLSIDQDTYVVRLRGRPLDLTYREFELLRFLAGNPRRVFTRAQLLQEVWGYDFFGGTRTVDVHIRRLRAKLGAEYEQLIGTVRGVGYKLDPQGAAADRGRGEPDAKL